MSPSPRERATSASADMLTIAARSLAIASIEMPLERTVIAAKVIAFKPRVFSSNRSRRYSGTECARDP